MMRNFSRINKSTSCLTSIFQKTSIRFLKDFGPQYIAGKMYSRHLFRNRGLLGHFPILLIHLLHSRITKKMYTQKCEWIFSALFSIYMQPLKKLLQKGVVNELTVGVPKRTRFASEIGEGARYLSCIEIGNNKTPI